MTAHGGEPGKSPTLDALTLLVCNAAVPPSPDKLRRDLNAVLNRLANRKPRRAALSRLSLAAILATTCVGILVVVLLATANRSRPSPPALAYHTQGGTVIEGGYLKESGHDGITMSFSEGTKFTLLPGAHGRLRSVDSEGAHLAIDNGTASFEVTPRKGARWVIDVGPFLVTVTGTIFTVSWDVSSERFELRLQQGRVTVGGPVAGGDIVLRTGQRLVVDLPKSETLITEEMPEKFAEKKPEEDSGNGGADDSAMSAFDPPDEQSSHESRRPLSRVGAEPSPARGTDTRAARARWSEAVAAADWDRILSDAEGVGIGSTLSHASSDDLMALADAARYRRRMALARDALLAQRRRFPTSTRSLDAAYLLGRVEESSKSGLVGALRWYDEYLARAPLGTYASEALGRKMILTSKLEGSPQARPLAQQYLRRFPSGAYAGSAQALLRAR